MAKCDSARPHRAQTDWHVSGTPDTVSPQNTWVMVSFVKAVTWTVSIGHMTSSKAGLIVIA